MNEHKRQREDAPIEMIEAQIRTLMTDFRKMFEEAEQRLVLVKRERDAALLEVSQLRVKLAAAQRVNEP